MVNGEDSNFTPSPKRAWVGWAALVASVFLCSGAHLLLRSGAAGGGGMEVFLRGKVILGLLIYGCGTALWLLCLSRVDLSIAFPASALQFIVVMAGAKIGLGESLPLLRVVGGAAILAGILLLIGDRKEAPSRE